MGVQASPCRGMYPGFPGMASQFDAGRSSRWPEALSSCAPLVWSPSSGLGQGPVPSYNHMGGCPNDGPLLGPLIIRCRIILRTQKGTIILTTTHIRILPNIPDQSEGQLICFRALLKFLESNMEPEKGRLCEWLSSSEGLSLGSMLVLLCKSMQKPWGTLAEK